jgi:YD repeat-containing protein
MPRYLPTPAPIYSGSYEPSISANGRYITFYSDASNLVSNDTNSTADVFVVKNPLSVFDTPTSINNLGSEINANGDTRRYTYDRIITSITDREGAVQRYTYDKLNRRTTEEWLDVNGNVTRNITNTYNAARELTQTPTLTAPTATHTT